MHFNTCRSLYVLPIRGFGENKLFIYNLKLKNMKNFQKLSRAEMKKVNGGVNGNCQEGTVCTAFTSPNDPNGYFGVSGTCTGSCVCVPDAPGVNASGTCSPD
jgi:hypothetical protein